MTIEVAAEVERALTTGEPVVALETTLISHGIPRPENETLAVEVEATVRDAGAVPATVGVVDRRVKVGLTRDELLRMAREDASKCSTRDLPLAVARGGLGATTVAATLFVAARVGIRVMATGGLGGVHRGGERSMDVSADLEELARRPVVVVCSGAKAILDLERTLERLETLGVPVVGLGCAELPGFYTRHTGLAIPRVDDLAGLVDVIRAHHGVGCGSGLVVAHPPPAAVAMTKGELDALVERALREADAAGVRGPAQTPFVLGAMARASGGRTADINHALVKANASLAGRLAFELALRRAAQESRLTGSPSSGTD